MYIVYNISLYYVIIYSVNNSYKTLHTEIVCELFTFLKSPRPASLHWDPWRVLVVPVHFWHRFTAKVRCAEPHFADGSDVGNRVQYSQII